jgi:large subunit ribosomal protein L24
MANKIKKDDKVIVTCGKDKGKTGVVLRCIYKDNHVSQVVVEGINVLKKHRKKSDKAEGAIVDFPAPLDVSNVAIVCPKKSVATRVGFTYLKDGEKKRLAKASGQTF